MRPLAAPGSDDLEENMRRNSIRERLRSGKPTISTRLQLSDPIVVETVGHSGAFDYVEFLAEYSSFGLRTLEEFCRAAELHSLGTMIKVDLANNRFVAQRSVGAGFESVLFTDARSAGDVREFMNILAPDTPGNGGMFSVAARRHALPEYGGTPEYVTALTDVVRAIMIEKRSAVADLDEIVAVPGIDMVQWGPADYAMSVGKPGRARHPEIRAVERHVIETCHAAGIPCRAEISTADEAKRYAELGVRHFSLGNDLRTLYRGFKDGGEQLRAFLSEAT
jgi:2-keto-3-deoxy-L-rhamnonate aldolase RhmA